MIMRSYVRQLLGAGPIMISVVAGEEGVDSSRKVEAGNRKSHVRIAAARGAVAGTFSIANPFKPESELECRGTSLARAGQSFWEIALREHSHRFCHSAPEQSSLTV